MRRHQQRDVAQVLDPFALPLFGITPRLNLAFERVLQRGDPGVVCVTTQRPGPRDASIATEVGWPG